MSHSRAWITSSIGQLSFFHNYTKLAMLVLKSLHNGNQKNYFQLSCMQAWYLVFWANLTLLVSLRLMSCSLISAKTFKSPKVNWPTNRSQVKDPWTTTWQFSLKKSRASTGLQFSVMSVRHSVHRAGWWVPCGWCPWCILPHHIRTPLAGLTPSHSPDMGPYLLLIPKLSLGMHYFNSLQCYKLTRRVSHLLLYTDITTDFCCAPLLCTL